LWYKVILAVARLPTFNTEFWPEGQPGDTDKPSDAHIKISGAIMKFWRQPLDQDQIQIPRGIIYIIDERCKGCGFCVEFCPRAVLVMSKETNSKGYHPPTVVDSEACSDCGLCTLLCPDFAIYVESSMTSASNKEEKDP
jgi:2-oxoglutarate ferredoxin oxidoreductase subunit delta